jgi:hypothetical protein
MGVFSIKFYPKNACVVHMFEFPSAETENADGMAKLQIFVTSLWSIATFFHFGAYIAILVKLHGVKV